MVGWHLETADGGHIPVSFNPGSRSVVADIQELPATEHSAFWVAPPSYLGDKVRYSRMGPPGLLCHCMSITYKAAEREYRGVQVPKMERIMFTAKAVLMELPGGRGVRLVGSLPTLPC